MTDVLIGCVEIASVPSGNNPGADYVSNTEDWYRFMPMTIDSGFPPSSVVSTFHLVLDSCSGVTVMPVGSGE